MTNRYGKILWASMDDDPELPYLCVRWSEDDPDLDLVALNDGEKITIFAKDIEMLAERGRVRWHDD